MARYQVILAYDGTRYLGFQRQAGGRTVQDVLETALRKLGWQGLSILAAGRTDTGVHASGQVIAFDLDWKHSTGELLRAINALLPPDIAVQQVSEAADDFHPRYDAALRRYRYSLFCSEARSPLAERYAWRVWPAVDAGLLERAAGQFLGRHDFAAFGTPPRAGGSTTRTVFESAWQMQPISPSQSSALVYQVAADAFLYRMVRHLVAFQVEIAQGRLDISEIQLRLSDRAPVRGLAPARGLTLVEVQYSRTEDPKGLKDL